MFKITRKDWWRAMIKSIAVTNNLNERLDLVLTNPEQSGIVVRSVSGLGPGKAILHINELANGDGGSYGGARTPVRNIVMNLAFLGNPTIEDTRQLTYRFFPLKKPITLTVFTDNLEVNIDGYVESNEPDIFSNLEGCQISILCENPYFYTAKDQITTSSGIFPMLEFPVDNELVEDPTIEKRIPSDEKYAKYGRLSVSEWEDNNVKYMPFEYTLPGEFELNPNTGVRLEKILYDVTSDDKSGKLPYVVSGHFKYSTVINQRNCMLFWLKIENYNILFNNDKKYTLSFLIDGKFLDEMAYVWNNSGMFIELDIEVMANNVTIYNSGYRHKYLDGYEDLPLDLITKSRSIDAWKRDRTKNRKIEVPLTEAILNNIYEANGVLIFKTQIGFMYYEHQLPQLKTDYAYPDGYYSILVHDVEIYENKLEVRDGFSDEIVHIYDWGAYDISLSYVRNWTLPLLFGMIKEKMKWLYGDDNSWRPQPGNGPRVFTLEFDIDASMQLKNNGNGSKDYLSLKMEFNDFVYYVDVCGVPVNGALSYEMKKHRVEISEDAYYNLLYKMKYNYGPSITFTAIYNRYDSLSGEYKQENPGWGYKNGEPTNPDVYSYTNSYINISKIRFYEVLQPTQDLPTLNKVNYLVDESMPDYAFTKNGKSYNLRASEGIIMGEIQRNGFTHLTRYEGSASIGFQITIGFAHSIALFNNSGLVGNAGYIIITSNFYPRKMIAIDLNKVYEIIQSMNDTAAPIPIGQPGDLILIDTRKKKKTIRYQKPYDYSVLDSTGPHIWKYSGYKINILASSNRDISWFELHQGDNELTIRHASNPDRELEEEIENNHSEYLEMEIRNQIYYEGV